MNINFLGSIGINNEEETKVQDTADDSKESNGLLKKKNTVMKASRTLRGKISDTGEEGSV